MSDQICPYCLNPKATGECGCPRVITKCRGGRIAELEAEVAKCRRVLTKSLANFNRKHRAHRQALAALLVTNVRLRADGERLDWVEQQTWEDHPLLDLVQSWTVLGKRYPEGLRAAIDAARKEKP